jgi:heme exporter protein A
MPNVPSPSLPLLAVRALAFSRDEVLVFGPLAFSVEANQALLVQGGNGAGKTTLLRVLAGLLRADAGVIEIEGVVADAASRAQHIAYLGHLPGLKADLSAIHNLNYLCGLHGRRRTQTAEAALGIVGLAGFEDAAVRTLSAGQKKRLGLARLWLSPAPLWLLDEPYANLDLDGIHLVNQMVQAHLREGGAALITTHGAYAAPPVRTRLLELGKQLA